MEAMQAASDKQGRVMADASVSMRKLQRMLDEEQG